MPARANHGTSSQTAPIIARFSSTGVAAGTAKRRQVLRTPADSATSDMKPMYGNIQRVMTTASSKRSRPEAISQTTTGAATTPTTQVTTQRPEQHGRDGVDQPVGRLVAVGGARRAASDRHEGLREGALGEQAAQQVGDAEGDVERVGRARWRRRSRR